MPSPYFYYNIRQADIECLIIGIAKILKYIFYIVISVLAILLVGFTALLFNNPGAVLMNMVATAIIALFCIGFFILSKFNKMLENAIYIFISKDNGLKITESELPELYRLVQLATNRLDFTLKDIYITNDPRPNAFAIPFRNHVSITITSSMIETMNKNELLFVIGHELGHHKFNKEHKFRRWYYQVAFSWYLEYYADLAGYEACQNLNDCVTAFVKFSAGKEAANRVQINNYLTSIIDRKYSIITKIISTHPPNEKRIYELKKYHEWLNSNRPAQTIQVKV